MTIFSSLSSLWINLSTYEINILLHCLISLAFFLLGFQLASFKVTFEGIRGPGWQGDIAIDEVSIKGCGGGGGEGGAGSIGCGGGCGEYLFAITSPIVMQYCSRRKGNFS